MRQRLAHWTWIAVLLLLPWQTRYIFNTIEIGGSASEYGTLSIYAVELLVVLSYVLRGRLLHAPGTQRFLKAVMVFVGVTFFSLALTNVIAVGWFQMLHLVTAFALLSLVLDERTSLKDMALWFGIGLLVPAGIGVYQVVTGGSGASTLLGLAEKEVMTAGVAVVETASSRMLRAYGSFPHPNIFGGYLAVGLLLLAWRARFIKTKNELWLTGVLVVVLTVSLIMTFSRGAWFGFLAATLLLIGQMLFARKMPPSRAIPLMTLGLVTVLITLGVFHNQLLARFNPSLHVEAVSIEERTNQYTQFNDVFFTSTLVGVGPGAYTFALSELDPGHEVWAYQPIHNVFLLVMAEVGVLGFLVGIRSLFLLRSGWQEQKQTAAGIFAVSMLALLCVVGLVDHYLWSLWPGMALSALAIGVSARLIQTNS